MLRHKTVSKHIELPCPPLNHIHYNLCSIIRHVPSCLVIDKQANKTNKINKIKEKSIHMDMHGFGCLGTKVANTQPIVGIWPSLLVHHVASLGIAVIWL